MQTELKFIAENKNMAIEPLSFVVLDKNISTLSPLLIPSLNESRAILIIEHLTPPSNDVDSHLEDQLAMQEEEMQRKATIVEEELRRHQSSFTGWLDHLFGKRYRTKVLRRKRQEKVGKQRTKNIIIRNIFGDKPISIDKDSNLSRPLMPSLIQENEMNDVKDPDRIE